jgi:DNA-binding CsgD family transcriptional regulator
LLPDQATTRIHALWDELAVFSANETETALKHAMQVLSELIDAQHAFWIGAVRLGIDADPLGGWRVRALRRLDATETRQLLKSIQQSHDHGIVDPITLAQVREAGVFRVRLLCDLAPPDFVSTPAYDTIYRARHIQDAIFAVFPVNADAESYFGWYRVGPQREPFSPLDRDLVAYALRALKWFHQRIMLHHGLLVAKAPLTSVERRLVSLLLTDRAEKEIAADLALTMSTTHTYITDLFRKFGVSGRAGLTAVWLGKPSATDERAHPSD